MVERGTVDVTRVHEIRADPRRPESCRGGAGLGTPLISIPSFLYACFVIVIGITYSIRKTSLEVARNPLIVGRRTDEAS